MNSACAQVRVLPDGADRLDAFCPNCRHRKLTLGAWPVGRQPEPDLCSADNLRRKGDA